MKTIQTKEEQPPNPKIGKNTAVRPYHRHSEAQHYPEAQGVISPSSYLGKREILAPDNR